MDTSALFDKTTITRPAYAWEIGQVLFCEVPGPFTEKTGVLSGNLTYLTWQKPRPIYFEDNSQTENGNVSVYKLLSLTGGFLWVVKSGYPQYLERLKTKNRHSNLWSPGSEIVTHSHMKS